jgi:hypothetical protein
MGGSHKSEGLDYDVVRLGKILINQREIYFRVLEFDAELALQVGERVLDYAEKNRGYRRASRPADKGDVSLVVRFNLKDHLASRIHLVTLRSEISEVQISCYAGPQSAVFLVSKRGQTVSELKTPYPKKWELEEDAVFVFSYSSKTRKARTITNDLANATTDCDLGWVDAREMGPPSTNDPSPLVGVRWVMVYERLIRSKEGGEMSRLSPDGRELFLTKPPSGPFPE